MLATRWQFVDDGEVLELELRDRVRFHDDVAFDAEAVRAILERGRDEAPSPVVRQQLAPIVEVDVAGARRVRLHLGDGAAALPWYLATAAGMMASPALAGSGPYVLDESASIAGERAAYMPSEVAHWDTTEPRFAGLTLIGIGEQRRHLDAFANGEVDVVDVRGDMYARAAALAADHGAQLVSSSSNVAMALQLNRSTPVLGDRRVRRAISMAIDRTAIVTELLHGRGTTAVQPLRPDMDGYAPELDRDPFDPAAARRLIVEAGADGTVLDVLQFAAVEPMTTLAAVLARQLAAVGIELRLHPLDPPALVEAWQTGGYDARTVFASSLPDPALTLHRRLNQAQNPGPLEHFSPELAALAPALLDQRATPDRAAEVRRRVNELIVVDTAVVELCRAQVDVLAVPQVAGLGDMAVAALNLYDVRDLSWPDP
jgi:peptide/nickel transport system substrate-binding protein